MARKDIVVVGASAGGMTALERLAAGLPEGFPAAMFVVWHLSPGVRSVLPRVLERAGRVAAVNPTDGDRIEPGGGWYAKKRRGNPSWRRPSSSACAPR